MNTFAVTFSPVHLCRVLLCQQNSVFTLSLHRVAPISTAHSTHIGSGAGYHSFLLIDPAARTNGTAARTHSLVPGSEKDLLATK